jgi:hypothetical protein
MSSVLIGHGEAAIVDVVMNGSGDMPAVVFDEVEAIDVAAYCTETWAQ